MRSRVPGLLLALVLAAVGLSACGGSSDEARDLVKQTFANKTHIDSGEVDLRVQLRTQGLASLDRQPIQARFSGPFDSSGPRRIPRFAFLLDAGAGGRRFMAGATSTGTRGFLSLQGDQYALPAAQYASFRQSFAQVSGLATAQRGSGDLPWLKDPKVAGDAEVEGVPTRHVTAAVDVPALLDSVEKNRPKSSPRFTPAQRAQLTKVITNPRFEFWTGKQDKLLRRVHVTFTLQVPEQSRSQAGGLRSAAVDLNYQLAALNTPQRITTPAGAKPIGQFAARLQQYAQALQTILGSAGGALGGGSTGGTGTTTGTTGATPPAAGTGGLSPRTQNYAKCLQQAGQDVAKQQRCAELLR